MSILHKIAHFQDRRDEVPNQELAKALVQTGNAEGIREIAANLWNADRHVQSDCLKVLYEIGYLNPDLIGDYAADFLKLLRSRNNRLVWGAMIALATIAAQRAEELRPHYPAIRQAMEQGSVITVDNGVKVLAHLARLPGEPRAEIVHYLFQHLRTCRPKDVPQHAEAIAVMIDAENRAEFSEILEQRMSDTTHTQAARLRKILRVISTY